MILYFFTRPQQINSSPPSAAYMRQLTWSQLVRIMACRLFGANLLLDPILTFCPLGLWEQCSVKLESKYKVSHSWKYISKCRLWNDGHFACGVEPMNKTVAFQKIKFVTINLIGVTFPWARWRSNTSTLEDDITFFHHALIHQDRVMPIK